MTHPEPELLDLGHGQKGPISPWVGTKVPVRNVAESATMQPVTTFTHMNQPAETNTELRVVVGVDGSACAERALVLAAYEAAIRGALLHVVSAYEVPPSAGWAVVRSARSRSARLPSSANLSLLPTPTIPTSSPKVSIATASPARCWLKHAKVLRSSSWARGDTPS